MCDYSLHAVASRPAKVGETLVATTFYGTSTRGFAAKEAPAVCFPGPNSHSSTRSDTIALALDQERRFSRCAILPDRTARAGSAS
jgi:hypothetical protein